MFGKLPELFNRNFAIGYFLPTSIFLIAIIMLADAFGFPVDWLQLNTTNSIDVIVGTTIMALVSWLISIILLGANREIYRVLEGYGKWNPARILQRFEIRKYNDLKKDIRELDKKYNEYHAENKNLPTEIREKRNALNRRMVTRFPDNQFWLLPTAFGNTIRAFEVYSRVMYGIDSIEGWSRLLAVIPEDYRKLIDDSKANVDFWVNNLLLGFLALLAYFGFVIAAQKWVWWLFPLLVFVGLFIAYSRSVGSVQEWGDKVKSAFDVFLPDLWKKMGFEIPETKEDKERLWQLFSQAVVYMRPDLMPDRKGLAKENDKSNKPPGN